MNDDEKVVKQQELRELIKSGQIDPGPNAFINQAGIIQLNPPQESIEDRRDKRDPAHLAIIFTRLRNKHPDWPAHKIADKISEISLRDGTIQLSSLEDYEAVYGLPLNGNSGRTD